MSKFIKWSDPNLDQIVVRLWKSCNFKCNFCNVWYNEKTILNKEDFLDLVRNFHYRFKYSDISSWYIIITISWWEPTLFQKEFIFILKYIKKFLTKKWVKPIFDLQTNASNIDISFANKIYSLWVSQALVSFHAYDSDVFEKLVWVDYLNIKNIITWINNLYKSWITVHFNTILSKNNLYNYFDTLKFLTEEFPWIKNYNLWIVQPHWEGNKNFNEVAIKYSDSYYIYNYSIAFLESKNKNVVSHFTWIPRCYLYKWKFFLEWEDSFFYRSNSKSKWKNLVDNINEKNKSHTSECYWCTYNNICSWIWNEYLGFQELKSKPYIKYFEKKSFNYLLDNKKSLRYFKSTWVENLIILSSNQNLYSLINDSVDYNIAKVIIFIDNQIKLNSKILNSWIWWIQKYFCLSDLDTFNMIINHNNLSSIQFKVNLDIFVDTYDENFIKIINEYKNTPYINFYIIYNFKDKSVYNYDSKIFYNKNVFSVNFYSNNIYKPLYN